jgi:hypothetical protein
MRLNDISTLPIPPSFPVGSLTAVSSVFTSLHFTSLLLLTLPYLPSPAVSAQTFISHTNKFVPSFALSHQFALSPLHIRQLSAETTQSMSQI